MLLVHSGDKENVPAKLWNWESNPFLLDDDFIFDIKEFWIQLSGPPDGVWNIYILDASNGNTLFSETNLFCDGAPGGQMVGPKWYRFNTSVTAQSISVLIQANSEASMTPLIPMMCYGFDLIYNTRRPTKIAGS